nr:MULTISPECIES: PilN domain-containing protein [Delftia]
MIIGAVYWWYQMMIEAQQAKNSMLRAEITVLESQIKEIAGLEDEITALRARQKAVEDLQSDRNLPVHMLNELVAQLPDGVYITSIRQEGLAVTMLGTAQSNERVSEMLRNLSEGTPWISKPELVEIVARTVNVTPKDQRRAAAFNLRFQLTRASVAEKGLPTAANPGKSQ